MDIFWKACAITLIALILMLTLGKSGQDMVTMITIAVCCMTAMAAVKLLRPFFEFLYSLQTISNLDNGFITTLLKITGIGLISEFVSMICTDAGSTSLGKNIEFLATSFILYLSIPIFDKLITLIQDVLGTL